MKIKNVIQRSLPSFFWLIYATLLISLKLHGQVTESLLQKPQTDSSKTTSHFANTKFTYKIIDAPNNTFGYDIYVDNRKLIHQPSTPAVAGNEGFKTKADAVKVAKIVIGKMKKGEWPPAVTVEEMKKLKVIK
jgi:hypothetical protein